MAAGSPEDAVRAFRTLRSATSDNNYAARALIELGMIARNQDRYAQALEYYKEVVETMSGSDYAEDALLAIESIYQLRQEPDAYLAYVESLGDKSGRDEGSKDNMYFSTAEEIFLSGNYPKAQSTFEAYLARFPKVKQFMDDTVDNALKTGEVVTMFGRKRRIPELSSSNKVLQAAGRVIRTENDTGIAVLMDERYTDNSYRRLFPREWKSLSIVSGDGLMQAVEDFWSLW